MSPYAILKQIQYSIEPFNAVVDNVSSVVKDNVLLLREASVILISLSDSDFKLMKLIFRILQSSVSPIAFLTGSNSVSHTEVYVVEFAAPTGKTSTPLFPPAEKDRAP